MGAHYQPYGHVHFLTNVIDFGMDVQEALDHPRVFYEDGRVVLERGIPDSVADELAQRGHGVVRATDPLGGGQAIWIGPGYGCADRRIGPPQRRLCPRLLGRRGKAARYLHDR